MRLLTRVVLAAVAACCLALPAGPFAARAVEEGPSADTVIAESEGPMGLAALARVHTVHEHGTVDILGVKGTADSWADLRDGRFAQLADAGPLSGAQGWDGTHVWSRDAGGTVWNDGGAAARYGAIQSAYMNSYALWRPDRGGATIVGLGRHPNGNRSADVLRVTPRGGLPFECWFDSETHLLVREWVPIGTSTTTTTFGNYTNVDGLKLPFSVSSTNEGGTFAFTVQDAKANDSLAADGLRRPAAHVDDWTLPSGVTRIPFELVDNHVDLAVMVNGKGPYHFLFDTGGSNLIDSGVAKELGLGAAGQAAAQGVGAGSEEFSFATVDALGIGSATLRKQVFAVVPVRAGFGISSGKPVDGLIGFEVLSRFVTTFDYGRSEIVLRSPAAAPPPHGTTVPFLFNGEHPQIACTIGGFAGDCTVDTGSRIGLSVDTPFLAEHPSIVPSDASAVGANGYGVGGAALGKLGRTTLAFGGFTFPRVIADLSTQAKGAFADPFLAGNIGAVEWKRFSVTFDYPHQTITLEPNAAFTAPETYDRSGLFLINQGGSIVVADVRPGTPAAQAGIHQGEVLFRVNDRLATTLGLSGVREILRGAAGTSVPVVFAEKGDTYRNVTIVLRDYV